MITARQPGSDPLRQTALELGRVMHSVRKYAPDDRLDQELDLWNALEPEELTPLEPERSSPERRRCLSAP